ncbi:hypothetical protein J4558_06475 [Leptolyngbya sp. 15MV]|nr:hypothetical protein J4558_06475 [Leptolyngbya sp. 15MV]
MSDSQNEVPNLPTELSAKAVLGFDDPTTAQWARLRGMQYARIGETIRGRLLGYGLGFMLMILVHIQTAGPLPLAAWSAMLGLALWHNIGIDRTLVDTNRRRMVRLEMRRYMTAIAIVATVWSMPLAWAAATGDLRGFLLSYVILVSIIACSALIVAATPVSTPSPAQSGW